MSTELKECSVCNKNKPVDQFTKNSRIKSGITSRCKECTNEYMRRYDDKNPEQKKTRTAKYIDCHREDHNARAIRWQKENKEANREIQRRYRLNNPDKVKAKELRYRLNNSDALNARNAKRSAIKKQALPAWADLNKIKEFYTEAKVLTESLGIPHHVDHIVPLQSDIVCGLHWEGNLQILTQFENISKSNRIWPDMPTESPKERA